MWRAVVIVIVLLAIVVGAWWTSGGSNSSQNAANAGQQLTPIEVPNDDQVATPVQVVINRGNYLWHKWKEPDYQKAYPGMDENGWPKLFKDASTLPETRKVLDEIKKKHNLQTDDQAYRMMLPGTKIMVPGFGLTPLQAARNRIEKLEARLKKVGDERDLLNTEAADLKKQLASATVGFWSLLLRPGVWLLMFIAAAITGAVVYSRRPDAAELKRLRVEAGNLRNRNNELVEENRVLRQENADLRTQVQKLQEEVDAATATRK